MPMSLMTITVWEGGVAHEVIRKAFILSLSEALRFEKNACLGLPVTVFNCRWRETEPKSGRKLVGRGRDRDKERRQRQRNRDRDRETKQETETETCRDKHMQRKELWHSKPVDPVVSEATATPSYVTNKARRA